MSHRLPIFMDSIRYYFNSCLRMKHGSYSLFLYKIYRF